MTDKQKRREKAPLSTVPPQINADAPLSPHWAFVVQFRVQTNGGTVSPRGRVEHLVSGRTARFESLDELAAYFARELGQHNLSSPM